MGILILILKIIGVLLAVLILLVAAAVAVPVRYRASVKVQDEIEGKAIFHWLLHAVDIRLSYGRKGLAWKCRILGIPVLSQKKGSIKSVKRAGKREGSGRQEGEQEDSGGQKEKKQSKPIDESEKREEEGSKEQAKKRVAESIQKQKEEIKAFEKEQEKQGAEESNQKQKEEIKAFEKEKEKQGAEESNQKQKEKTAVFEKEKEKQGAEEPNQRQKEEIIAPEKEQAEQEGRPLTGAKIEPEPKEEAKDPGRLGRLKSFLAEGKPKVSAIKARIHNIKTLIFEETNQKAFCRILQELKCLLHHFAPRKASGEMEFGMGDPAQTGEVLGIISFLPFWAKYQVAVTPDFMAESMYARGEISGRGHIRIWHLLPSGIRLFKDKNIHRLIAAIRQ